MQIRLEEKRGREKLTSWLVEERQRLKHTTESNLARGRELLRWWWSCTWNLKQLIDTHHAMCSRQANQVANQKCHLPGHCASLSVSGTYTTPISGVRVTVPSAFLSICSSCWLPPSGPTGTINRPPGFSWSISYHTIITHLSAINRTIKQKLVLACNLSLTNKKK